VIADEYSSMTCICHAKFFARWPQNASAYYMIMVGLTRLLQLFRYLSLAAIHDRYLWPAIESRADSIDFPPPFFFSRSILSTCSSSKRTSANICAHSPNDKTSHCRHQPVFFSNMVKYINSRMNWFFSRQSAEHR